MPNHRPAPYLEAHSALNGPLLAYGVLPLAAEAACFTLGLAANLPWFFVLMGPLFLFVLISVGPGREQTIWTAAGSETIVAHAAA